MHPLLRRLTDIIQRQFQLIDPTLLPQSFTTSFVKKADLAWSFTLPDEAAPADKTLSQMMNEYTRRIPLVGGIEVKVFGGDALEALVQLSIWSAADLEKIRLLQEEHLETVAATSEHPGKQSALVEKGELLPFFGWTIVGHDWKLHIMWKEVKGDVVSYGLLVVLPPPHAPSTDHS